MVAQNNAIFCFLMKNTFKVFFEEYGPVFYVKLLESANPVHSNVVNLRDNSMSKKVMQRIFQNEWALLFSVKNLTVNFVLKLIPSTIFLFIGLNENSFL